MSVAPVEEVEVADRTEVETPWVCVVWNDPVNLMSYVTYVFMTYFGYPRAKAEQLMLDVHQEGRAIGSPASRDACAKGRTGMSGASPRKRTTACSFARRMRPVITVVCGRQRTSLSRSIGVNSCLATFTKSGSPRSASARSMTSAMR